MRAIVCSTDSPGRICFREVPEPVPNRDEAIVEVHAVSLNRGEFRRLQWATDGWRPGYDVAGVVVAAAEDGTSPEAGTRVVGLLPEGAWAERVAIPTRRLSPLPANLDFTAASTVPVAGLTSLAALAHFGPLPGKRVLITGAAGGVGRFAIQLATLMGGRVTALVRNPERGRGLEALGAERIVTDLATDTDEFDAVLESVGGEVLGLAIARRRDQRLPCHDRRLVGHANDLRRARARAKGSRHRLRAEPVPRAGAPGDGERRARSAARSGGERPLDPQVDRVASWRGDAVAARGAR